MKTEIEKKGKLSIIRKLEKSINGNPRFAVMLNDGANTVSCVTKTDSLFAYEIEKFNGKQVVAKLCYSRGKMMILDAKVAR